MKYATTLAQAKIILDRERFPLNPESPEDRPYYVERSREVLDEMLVEAESSANGKRPFRWFFSGHTGAGKSTELNRILKAPRLLASHLPAVFNIKDSLDFNELDFTDLILAIAQATVEIARNNKINVPKVLQDRIKSWGQEIDVETEIEGGGSATGGVEWNLWFVKATAEIQAGGSRKKIIREKLRNALTDFIALIDQLAQAIETQTDRQPLIILDGLDHVDFRPVKEIFTNHWASISRPRVSLLTVIPLPLVNEPEFMAYVGNNHSLLPNIKVFQSATNAELDSEGFDFFKSVITALADPALFSDAALQEIFRLSAGMLRDMIGIAGEAARHADTTEGATQVGPSHVARVLDERKAYFRRLLLTKDYTVLRNVQANPYPLGFDGIGPLLHLKAIVFYPNGEGWYGLNPAVQAILDASPNNQPTGRDPVTS